MSKISANNNINEHHQEVKKYDEDGHELAIRFSLGAIKAVGVTAMSHLVENRQEKGDFKDIYNFAARLGSKILNKKSVEALAKAGAFDQIHPNRHQIFESCDIICKYSATKEEENNSDQMNLFGSGSTLQMEDPTLKDVVDWNKEQKLQKEFEAFGFFVNEHPLDDFLDDLKKRGVIFSNLLQEDLIKDNSLIKLSGVVAYSKHKSGPKGRFAYLTLSDPIGIYETSIFDEGLITNSRDLMEPGMSLVLLCLMRKDEGGSRLLVKEIYSLEDFIKNNKASKEPYEDIKIQVRKERNFGWNKEDKYKPENDPMLFEMERKRKMDELRKKDIFEEIFINIGKREAIFNIKSFLSQRLAPEELEKATKVFIVTGENKIELADKYIIEKSDKIKLELITGVSISLIEGNF